MSEVILTPYGKLRLQAEIESIRLKEIPQVKKRLEDAQISGINLWVEDAEAELEFYEKRIPHLENMIATAKIVGEA